MKMVGFKSDRQRKAMFSRIRGIRVSNVNPVIIKNMEFKKVTGNILAVNIKTGKSLQVERLSKNKALVRTTFTRKKRVISNKDIKFI